MDLIYTNAQGIEQGVLLAYSLDLSFGADANENDFELTLGSNEPLLEYGSIIQIEGTEYGGIVGGLKSATDSESRISMGRTWHGVLNSKVIAPDAGKDYLTVSGDANTIIKALIARLGLSGLFSAPEESSGVTIKSYQFSRYCKAYDGLRAMLSKHGGKLKIKWENSRVVLSAALINDYSEQAADGDTASLTVERHSDKVNHLICLGAGDLAAREVIHLYVDQFGRVGSVQYYTGLNEITDVYDYSSAQSTEELLNGGIDRLNELRNNDKLDITAYDGTDMEYDIGDIVGGTDVVTGNYAKATVAQKIVKINNGAVSIEYKTGG